MAWEKTHNIWSEDAADSLAPKNLQKTNMLGSIWGKNLPASTKEDSSVQRMIVDRVRETFRRFGPSGWSTRGAFSFSAGYPANAFRAALSKAIVDGLTLVEVGSGLNSETASEFTLPAPPGSGTRNDLVWLEMFLVEVPGSTASVPVSTNKPSNTTIYKYGNKLFGGTNPTDDINEVNYEIRRRVQVQYRIRTVGGVDFTTYPNGLGDPGVFAQGPQAAPTALLFAAASGDAGLWVAGNGSAAHQSILGTLDGYVYAVPIAKVARSVGVTEIQTGAVTDLRITWGGVSLSGLLAPYTIGDLFYASNPSTLAKLSAVASGQVLASQGVGQVPAYTANPAVSSIALGTNPAQSGLVRLANNGAIVSRNALNVADIELLKLDGSDIVQLASGGQAVYVGGNLQRGAMTGHYLLQAAQASAAQPTYSFVGDANTGMYRVGEDVLAFSTAGSERVRITASGNAEIIRSVAGAVTEVLKLTNRGTGSAGHGARLAFYGGDPAVAGEYEFSRIDGYQVSASATAGGLKFSTGNQSTGLLTEALRIDESQRIFTAGTLLVGMGSLPSGTTAGDVVMPEGKALRSVFASASYRLIYGTGNQTHVDWNGSRAFFDGAQLTATAGAISTYWEVTFGAAQYRIPLYALG